MPYRSKKPCNQPGCSELVKAEFTYCENHREIKKEKKRERDKKYNKEKRDPKLRKFYSSWKWRKCRDKYVKQNPLCEKCKENGKTVEADEVDHIIPVKVRFDLRFDFENLQSLCKRCHSIKSRKDRQEYDL